MYVCMYVCMHACMHACMRACMCHDNFCKFHVPNACITTKPKHRLHFLGTNVHVQYVYHCCLFRIVYQTTVA